MGLLQQLLGRFGGGMLGKKMKTGNPLVDALLPMLAGGGLASIIGKLGSAGLGAQASSWVGTGQNEPVDPNQLAGALGPDTVDQLAQQSGMSHDEVKGGLASLLPKLVDQATPDGQVTDLGSVANLAKNLDLSKLLG